MNDQQASQKTIKGFFLKNLARLVEKEKGPEGTTALKNLVGNIDFSATVEYPVEIASRFLKGASTVLFGNDSPDSMYKLGKKAAQIFRESPIGKTMFTLIGINPKAALISFQKIIQTVFAGVSITSKELGENKVKVSLIDFPMCSHCAEGVFTAVIESFDKKPTIEIDEHQNIYDYTISWE